MNSILMLYLHPNHQLHKLEMEVQFVRRRHCVFRKQAWRHGSIRLHLSRRELKLLESNYSNCKKDFSIFFFFEKAQIIKASHGLSNPCD